MAVGLFCALRTSKTLGLQWKAYQEDKLVVQTTAFEGKLYQRMKTDASRSAVPVPEDIRPIIEAWRRACPNTPAEALMFPTLGRNGCTFMKVPRHAKNFLKWRIYPIPTSRRSRESW
jgi:integrase